MTKTDRDTGDDEKPQRVEQGTSVVEWIAAAVGAIVIITMVAYMAYVGLHEGDSPPRIELTSDPAVRQGDVYLVAFRAKNTGGATAADLVIRATLSKEGQDVETADITIDYLPSNSEQSGGFYFKNDPDGLALDLAPTSYIDP